MSSAQGGAMMFAMQTSRWSSRAQSKQRVAPFDYALGAGSFTSGDKTMNLYVRSLRSPTAKQCAAGARVRTSSTATVLGVPATGVRSNPGMTAHQAGVLSSAGLANLRDGSGVGCEPIARTLTYQ
jgi:hypothetical protein